MNNIPYDLLRDHYAFLTPRIIEVSVRHPSRWVTPYHRDIDFVRILTTIEFYAWQVIRCYGRFPLYPQYPVGKYWADFANPYFKIAVECDGKDYHMDKEKDRARDFEFHKMGWKVFRISGADCNRVVDINHDDLHLEEMSEERDRLYREYFDSTIEGLIKSLGIIYSDNDDPRHQEYYPGDNFTEYELAVKCLHKRAVKFNDTYLPF